MGLGRAFEGRFTLNETNRFVGSGGEQLVKGAGNTDQGRMEVGDRLIGIGITHLIEAVERPPGPESYAVIDVGDPQADQAKLAARAFQVTGKTETADGYAFAFAPLEPAEYSALVEEVSEGQVRLDPATIPEGTMVVSYLDENPTYTLRTLNDSPGANWREALKGRRHWNVGRATDEDFWAATFPSDDVASLTETEPTTRLGTIRFGLSLLPGSTGHQRFERVPFTSPTGAPTSHHFCLTGTAVGTQGLTTPFPIGLRTEITFHPLT